MTNANTYDHLVINHINLESASYSCCSFFLLKSTLLLFHKCFLIDTFPCTHTTKTLFRPRLKTTKTFLLNTFYILIWEIKNILVAKTLEPSGYVFMKLKNNDSLTKKNNGRTRKFLWNWNGNILRAASIKFTFVPGYGLHEQTATQHVSIYYICMHYVQMYVYKYIHIYTHSCDLLCIYHEYMTWNI